MRKHYSDNGSLVWVEAETREDEAILRQAREENWTLVQVLEEMGRRRHPQHTKGEDEK